MRLQRSGEMVQGQANPAQVSGLYPGGSRAPSMVLEQNRDRSSTDVEGEGLDRGRLGGQWKEAAALFPGRCWHLDQDKGSGECRQRLPFSTSQTPQLSTPALSTASAPQGCAFPHIPTTEKGPTSLLVMRPEAPEKETPDSSLPLTAPPAGNTAASTFKTALNAISPYFRATTLGWVPCPWSSSLPSLPTSPARVFSPEHPEVSSKRTVPLP